MAKAGVPFGATLLFATHPRDARNSLGSGRAGFPACRHACSTSTLSGCSYMGRFSPDHSLAEHGDFLHPHHPARAKNVACEEGVLIGLCFRASLSRRPSHPGEKNGQHTHDTSRFSHHTKSLNSSDRKTDVRHRWGRFYLRALWTCHVRGFRSFNSQGQSCLSVRRL